MKSLKISINTQTTFSPSLVNLIYDLGHDVVTKGDLSKELQLLCENLNLQAFNAGSVDLHITQECTDIDSGAHNIILNIHALPGLHQYQVAWFRHTSEGYQTLENISLDFGSYLNGADIYQEISAAVVQTLSSIISTFAQASQNYTHAIPVISYLPEAADLQQLRVWHKSNDTDKDFVINESSLFDILVKSAQRHANKNAITFQNQTLSYEQLKDASEAFSHFLHKRIGEYNTDKPLVIALALHKSLELYTAIFGVLGVGATYVPIDPEYPEERINNIIKSAQPELLITHADAKLATEINIPVVNIDSFFQGISIDKSLTKEASIQQIPVKENFTLPAIDAEKPAVIIYTSGSTGTPKGVQLSHKNILHFCYWYKNHVQLNEKSKVLQFTTVSFDASLLDIFPTFLAGAELIAPDKEERHDFMELHRLVTTQAATHSFIPPAMLAALPDYEWPSMVHIVTGGDVCDPHTIARWSKNRALHNIYGPTECTVLATTEQFYEKSNNKIIGRPISNTKTLLLNESLEPVVTNEHGELYIVGEGVGLGYFNADEMTQQRFIANPYKPNAFMYKTGDTCYWDQTGKIHFVGRKDNQLKIRGFRVELGEIENVILDSGLYNNCSVVANDKKQIRAFVMQPSLNASVSKLEEILVRNLPYYMLPSHIMELDQFPATVNGKIDRVALLATPVPDQVHDCNDELNETEESVRRIWAHTLDLDENDINKKESFFSLGGHSLLVSKMLLAVKNQFAGSFTLARFMENPTIEGLASLLTNNNLQKGDQISDRIYSDMVLDSAIKPLAEKNPSAYLPKAILLTGANGFLGVHLLEELIVQTDATIYCLVRASSEEYALKKLADAYQKYGVTSLVRHPRVKVLLGDLEQSQLGLSEKVFTELAEKIDAIYHNGAQVNHIYDYDYLYNSNVRSTLDLLRLAVTAKNKQLVFVSTLSAASNIDSQGRLVEDGPSEQLPAFVNNGYNLTKWVSEQLVWQAHKRGVAITLVRPGNICGHSKTGHCYPDQNRILLLLKGSAQLGFAPDWDSNFDLCPVDFIAKGVVASSTCEKNHIPVLHFHNPTPLTWCDYVNRLNHHHVPVTLIPPQQWRRMLFTLDESNALFNVISFYLDDENEDIGDISTIDHHKTLARLQEFGMSHPVKDKALIDANLGFLVRTGFIKPNILQQQNETDLTNVN